MQITNVCFLLRDQEILLAMKKRGFGQGKWNGVGGKVNENETNIESVIREAREEIDVEIKEKDIQEAGYIKFRFLDKPEWNQNMTVYTVYSWRGEPEETKEMKPKWFALKEIPYSETWPDDKFWLPKILSGQKIDGEFHFLSDGKTIKYKKVIERKQ